MAFPAMAGLVYAQPSLLSRTIASQITNLRTLTDSNIYVLAKAGAVQSG
jgi:hypothetical protein